MADQWQAHTNLCHSDTTHQIVGVTPCHLCVEDGMAPEISAHGTVTSVTGGSRPAVVGTFVRSPYPEARHVTSW
jgi:hypothetical protein